jgi:uncharacterized protein (TIGR02271 family)
MSKSVIAVFDERNEAILAEQELMQLGIRPDDIHLVEPTDQPAESWWDRVKGFFGRHTSEEDELYQEAARRGGFLLTANVADESTEQAVVILERHHPIDLNRIGQPGTTETLGTTGTTTPGLGTGLASKGGIEEAQGTLPIAEESLKVGTRPVSGGAVRVHTYVTETPVEEEVRLREERVVVERTPTDRPAGEGAFQERTIEATEMREEPVIQKEARIVEEVSLGKTSEERVETVRDTLRRTEVDVERDNDFRRDFDTRFGSQGLNYDEYRPMYDYGGRLALDERYRGRNWDDIETDARRDFEGRYPGKWDRFRDSVRYGFERGRR